MPSDTPELAGFAKHAARLDPTNGLVEEMSRSATKKSPSCQLFP